MARIEWPEFYFKRLQETSTVILPRKAHERGWEYGEYPHHALGLLGQNRGNGENRTVTGDISIPRYLHRLSAIRGKARALQVIGIAVFSRAQRLTAIRGKVH
jgi:hypothetical protein